MATKQKSGLYRTKIKIGVDPDGKDINKWISAKTKRELEEKKHQAFEHYINGTTAVEDKLFGQCAVEWMDELKAAVKRGERSESTLQSYRTALNKDILPAFAMRNMRAISAEDLQKFVSGFSGKSQTKITYITATLDGVFVHACRTGILKSNPFEYVKKPKASTVNERRALTEDERARVLDATQTHEHGLYLACMYYLGARPGEIRGLQWGDINWDKCTVHIQRDIDYKKSGSDKVGGLKNAKSNRFVPIPARLMMMLEEKRGESDKFIFQGKINKSALAKTTAERMWVELMLECDMAEELPANSNGYRECDIRSKYKPIITPHTMRHNYVTMCWENGIDVYTASKLVGHKSIKTTMDIYTHLSESQMDKAIDEVARMFNEQKKLHKSCTKRFIDDLEK